MNKITIMKGFPFEPFDESSLNGEGSGGSGGFPG